MIPDWKLMVRTIHQSTSINPALDSTRFWAWGPFFIHQHVSAFPEKNRISTMEKLWFPLKTLIKKYTSKSHLIGFGYHQFSKKWCSVVREIHGMEPLKSPQRFFWALKVQTRRTERSRGHSKYKYPVRSYPFVYFPVRGAGSLIFVILVLCILQMMAIPCVLMDCCNPAVTQSWRKRFVRILWHSIKIDATSALYRWKLRIYH